MEKIIYSIGHSNKTFQELLNKLKENGITDLIDVRTYPTSKYNPQFKKANLEVSFANSDIKYHWRGRNLGGLQGNVLFDETIAKMLNASSNERKLCVMCSEAKPEDCHRSKTIEDSVNKQGGRMVHILWTEKKGDGKIVDVKSESLFDSPQYKD